MRIAARLSMALYMGSGEERRDREEGGPGVVGPGSDRGGTQTSGSSGSYALQI